jgi:hypothetical protein
VSEEFDVLRLVTTRLDGAGITYMITGAIAMNYYGIPRLTRDIDIVAEIGPDDHERVCSLLHDEFYMEQDAIKQALDQRHPFSVIHVPLVVKVDFVPRKQTDYHRAEFERKKQVTVEGHAFHIVTAEDLIISKMEWAAVKTRATVQLGDVRNLLRAAEKLDRVYLDRWINRLGMAALYREVQK